MFSVIGKLGWYFKMEWRRYSLAVGLLIFVGFLEVIPPRLLGYTIDGISQGRLADSTFYWIVGGWLAITISSYLITYGWMSRLFGGANVLERLLRGKLMGQFMRMTPTFYERNRTGDLMARSTNDLWAISMTAGFGILTLVDSTVWMLTLLGMMIFLISWKLTLAALLPLPIIALLMAVFGRMIHDRFLKAQDAFGELNDEVLESVSGVRVVRAYVQEEADRDRFHAKTNEVLRRNIAVARVDALFEPVNKILVGLSYIIGLVYGGVLVFQGEITLGDLISFNIFLGMLIWPMFAIGELINVMQRGSASLDRVEETLHTPADVEDKGELVQVEQPGEIMFADVTFRYPSSKEDNLSNVSFRLPRGGTLGIVGRTGSGKTTILKQLIREYPAGSGHVAVSGVSIDRIPLDRLLGWFGYVPQQPILFSRTIRENILFGAHGATEEDLERALVRASFAKDVLFLPDGLETLVGEKGVALSGGQKQRVSIARALIADPEILLLDDALSAVDAKTEAEIIEGIRTERAGKTTIITTHRLSAVQHADLILVMENGRIAEEGTHEQLLQQGGWYREQYDRQQLEAFVES
ncbi:MULTISPECIES: ABC transporter transmembrane domain-containing protein [unclassified Paenibacillus]|uniref:ABC transporter ATP-binding protein n=1 Tax=unclassified Paenibacillus TaxID=185978 RepID=UPI000955E8A6|nr:MULTISPECIES: ABC transporter transmembrane domain-containing protein [unclassified Paenibacillus]ASS66868.1 ATP-binding cassette domain-containing protein [Paenibacillus sp. RUD330]SIR71749.1 ATP-binding cassette, subfamily B [Paenibacillus sp. RU4X]SIR79123.1 ATP-binding cassette, subfamily B [Paenibacillus sp. RU4T]